MNFRPTEHRTSKGPIYRDADSGYTIVQDTNGWYARDETGFVFLDRVDTLREATDEAASWRQEVSA